MTCLSSMTSGSLAGKTKKKKRWVESSEDFFIHMSDLGWDNAKTGATEQSSYNWPFHVAGFPPTCGLSITA